MLSLNFPTLKKRLLHSGSWTIIGYGVNQALRLGGNLVLTRLLFPEAFGIMAIIQAAIFGITMLTDMGISQAIIQHHKGDQTGFLNTAWTMQIIRGILGWIMLAMLAIPLAHIYHEPILAQILPVIGISAFIGGFLSTKQYTAQRNLSLARITQIEIASYALGLAITVLLAWLHTSVWSLVWGQMITVSLRVIFSHVFVPGENNRIAWDREVSGHLVHFGRWILLSSSLTFLSVEGARLLIGAILDMRLLAMYTLANTLNLMLWQVALQIISRVFFPAYSEVYRAHPDNLFALVYKARLILIVPSMIIATGFVFLGSDIMSILYDARYRESGLILELLAAGTLMQCIWGSYTNLMIATGKVATETTLNALQIILQLILLYVGHHYFGTTGMVIGITAASWLMYPIYAYTMHRHKLWQPRLDMAFILISCLILAMAWPHLSHINISS